MVDDGLQLSSLPALRDENCNVAFRGHSEIAVHRFGEMEEGRGRPGRCEGRGDLSGDMS
jgi:hypothetical protein